MNHESDSTSLHDPLRTMNLPISEHFYRLECMLEELIDGIEETDKDIQMLKGDFLSIGYENNQQNAETSQFVQDEIARLGKEKQRLQEENERDAFDFKSLFQRVSELRRHVSQETIVAEHRLNEVESSVGFKYFFDPTIPSDDVN